ncbi:MAG: BatA domain-containing protein [Puniceicoccales bacterium]|jgi:hypothetical protein|nr:BatA domain-containing protein [Puniceicoccales bacterium]
MPVIFDNPAGFWALLGIPTILLIHTLQARSRKTKTSTLFLLDRLAPESRGGWQWERLRSSLPLWLQMLAVLALTWIIVEPRWVRPDASQQIVVVLDSSLSMEASLSETRAKLPARLEKLKAYAMRTEWTLLESNLRMPTVYRGDRLEELSEKLNTWSPSTGEHDYGPALQLATSLVRGAGVVIFVTDHAMEVPDGAAVLSFADRMDNTGFVGSIVDESERGTTWNALVRNHGASARSLEWRMRVDERESPPQPLQLAAGETKMIGGVLPLGAGRATVLLTPDVFALDDQLPLVKPVEKTVRIGLEVEGPERETLEKIFRGISNVKQVGQPSESDLRVMRRIPTPPAPPSEPDSGVSASGATAPTPASVSSVGVIASDKPAIIFPSPGAIGEKLQGWVVVDKNPLVANTSWDGLICQESAGFNLMDEDTVLVWRDNTPLVFLRQEAPRPALPVLLFNFDVTKTNAARLPAFVILIRRYIESCRTILPEPFALNADTQQRIPIAYEAAKGELSLKVGTAKAPVSAAEASVFRAPSRPGFFQVLQGDSVLLEGAAQFADAREADLSALAPADTLSMRERSIAHASSAPDPYRAFWLVLLLALPLGAWAAGRTRD